MAQGFSPVVSGRSVRLQPDQTPPKAVSRSWSRTWGKILTMRTILRVALPILLLSFAWGDSLVAQKPPMVEVYKDPTCGCCVKWVEHLRSHGFTARTTNVENIGEVKEKYHVPSQALSCHTAIVGGYVIEGHVPASEIHRLLKERPAAAGLAVPNMPIGSPGMEGANARPYNVLTFDKQGRMQVYSTQRP